MNAAKVRDPLAMPKAARHAFGVDAVQNSVALNIIQRWMGHARIETTAIYADVIGREERALARRTWRSIEKALGDETGSIPRGNVPERWKVPSERVSTAAPIGE